MKLALKVICERKFPDTRDSKLCSFGGQRNAHICHIWRVHHSYSYTMVTIISFHNCPVEIQVHLHKKLVIVMIIFGNTKSAITDSRNWIDP
jgi:hypothetical protein